MIIKPLQGGGYRVPNLPTLMNAACRKADVPARIVAGIQKSCAFLWRQDTKSCLPNVTNC